jgi:hypothetical protein
MIKREREREREADRARIEGQARGNGGTRGYSVQDEREKEATLASRREKATRYDQVNRIQRTLLGTMAFLRRSPRLERER